MVDEQLVLYDLIDPHDFRVGHRYRFAPSGQEHDFMVVKVELVDPEMIVVTYSNGDQRRYPAHQLAVKNCDVLED